MQVLTAQRESSNVAAISIPSHDRKLAHAKPHGPVGRGEGGLELGKILASELDLERGEIFLDARRTGRFGDYDSAGLVQQPRQRDLCRAGRQGRRKGNGGLTCRFPGRSALER